MKNFEKRLARLEEISQRIKNSDVPLEEAFSLFEEGVKLSDGLEKDIEKLEGKVQILMNGEALTEKESTKQGKKPEPEFELFSDSELA